MVEEKVLKKINVCYTELLTHTYKGTAGEVLIEFGDLLKQDSDKMSVQLFADCVKKYKDKLPDTAKLKLAEKIAGKNADITTGIAFLSLAKGDHKTPDTLIEYAADMAISAFSENSANKEKSEMIVRTCDDFKGQKKQLIRMQQAGELMARFDELRGKN